MILTVTQKRKSTDERGDHQPAAKKARQAAKAKEPRPPKEPKVKTKKPAAPKKPAKVKAKRPESDIPLENRRRSGRATNISKYTERDSSDDDKEMWDGVQEWEYIEGQATPEPEGSDTSVLSDAPQNDDEENEGSKKPSADVNDSGEDSPLSEVEAEEAADSEKEDQDQADDDDEEAGATPPPKSNGRKGKSAAAPSKAAAKTKLPARPAPKEKPAPRAATRSSGRSTRGKPAKESMDIDNDDE